MALLSYQQPKLPGTTITYAAAAAGGDTIGVGTPGVLRVKNGSAATITVTIVTPYPTRYGQPEPDIPIAVAAGAEVAIGPFPNDLAADGIISILYSAVATVTVAHS